MNPQIFSNSMHIAKFFINPNFCQSWKLYSVNHYYPQINPPIYQSPPSYINLSLSPNAQIILLLDQSAYKLPVTVIITKYSAKLC
ncbi:unnamed protein product [Blepharisma stoltei]|uniref:Uncharacterized protein n=1 Tax=Blepharisma stoltei TaxID=1481888 RepID=A0AAU9J7N8_9CILI|nr:unnamed protein product [Blepharisma stoltei]